LGPRYAGIGGRCIEGEPASRKVHGQSLRLSDQRRGDAFSIFVRDLDVMTSREMTHDQRCDTVVPGSADQVALPMAWHGAIVNGRGGRPDDHRQ
jgi:hypothetical protein